MVSKNEFNIWFEQINKLASLVLFEVWCFYELALKSFDKYWTIVPL